MIRDRVTKRLPPHEAGKLAEWRPPRGKWLTRGIVLLAAIVIAGSLIALMCGAANTSGLRLGDRLLLGPGFHGISLRHGDVTLSINEGPERMVEMHERGGTGFGGPAEPMRGFLQPGELAGVKVYYWRGWFLIRA
jgi:hypothetical protein